jgi:hypothetical protein
VHLADAGHMLPQAAPHAVNDAITWVIGNAGNPSKSLGAQCLSLSFPELPYKHPTAERT